MFENVVFMLFLRIIFHDLFILFKFLINQLSRTLFYRKMAARLSAESKIWSKWSVENLASRTTRKSDCIPLTTRKRSSSVPNNGVKKEFSNCAVQIAIRIRPFLVDKQNTASSESLRESAVFVNETSDLVSVKKEDQEYKFNFEHIFVNSSDECLNNADAQLRQQEVVYKEVGQPLVDAMLNGYNCCFLAYGQTGSGKTYSTMGPAGCPGVVPRFCEELLGKLQIPSEKRTSWTLEVGYYEIYNEKIRDLLINDSKHPHQLKIREHPESGPYIDGLVFFMVQSYENIQSWMDFGNKQRATSATAKNEQSSRSHAIFMLKLTQKKVEELDYSKKEYTRTSTVYLVDLAGSERAHSSTNIKETSSINKSLSCLGNVILQLAEKKQQYINYRDSVLTWLLKEYIGGNAKTCMLVTISPSEVDIDETLSSLRYASQAKAIVNRICVNEDPALVVIKKLKSEIESLKQQLKSSCATSSSETDSSGSKNFGITTTSLSYFEEVTFPQSKFHQAPMAISSSAVEDTLIISETNIEQKSSSFESYLLPGVESLLSIYSPRPESETSLNSTRFSPRLTSKDSIDVEITDANMFLNHWNAHFKFFLQDELIRNTETTNVFRVGLTDTMQDTCTFMSVHDFERRLEKLRNIYECGSVTGASLEEVLKSPIDIVKLPKSRQSFMVPFVILNGLKRKNDSCLSVQEETESENLDES